MRPGAGGGAGRAAGGAEVRLSVRSPAALHVSLVFAPERGLLAFVCRSLGVEEVGRHRAALPGAAKPCAVRAS